MSHFARSFTLVALFVSAASLPLSLNAQRGVAGLHRDSIAAGIGDITMPMRGMSVDSARAAGPRVARAGIAMPVIERMPGVAPIQSGGDAHVGAGSNVALMGVGIAGLVAGSMIGGNGGTMIAIGGGVVGLIGLYRFLR